MHKQDGQREVTVGWELEPHVQIMFAVMPQQAEDANNNFGNFSARQIYFRFPKQYQENVLQVFKWNQELSQA